MHDDCALARHGDSGAFEADPLAQFRASGWQGAVGTGSAQNHGRGLMKQAAQMGIVASRDEAVVIHLTGWVAARGQPDPGHDRAGCPDVCRILDGCDESGRGDRADTWNGHHPQTVFAMAGMAQHLAPEFGSTTPDGDPGFQLGQDDVGKIVLSGVEPPDLGLEPAAPPSATRGRTTPTRPRSRTRPAVQTGPAGAEPWQSRRDLRGICRARPAGHPVAQKSPSPSTTRPDRYIRTWLFCVRCLGQVSDREPVSSSYRGTTTRPKLAYRPAWRDSLPRLPHVGVSHAKLHADRGSVVRPD